MLHNPGSALSTCFGPYVVRDQLSETDYVMCTSDRRHQTHTCHANIIKAHHSRHASEPTVFPGDATGPMSEGDNEDGVMMYGVSNQSAGLLDSEVLSRPTWHIYQAPLLIGRR